MAAPGQRVGYIRVSSIEQNTDRQEVTLVEEEKVDKIFSEKISGKDMARPQLQACLAYLREGDELLVTELSRLGRSLMDVRQIVDGLVARKISFHALKERIHIRAGEQASPMDKLTLNLMASFAEFERELIRQRQREGIAVARAKGVYSKERSKKLKPEQLVQIREAIERGTTHRELAAQYGVSRQTIWNHLRAEGRA